MKHLGAGVHLDVAPVQVKDGVALLTADFTLADGAPKETDFYLGNELQAPYKTGDDGAGDVRLVDLATSTVFPAGLDSVGKPTATRDFLELTPGKRVRVQVFSRAPSGKTVSVLFPYYGLVPDVPVVDLGSGAFDVTPVGLGATGDVTFSSAPIDAYTVAFDDSSSTRVSGEAVTATLASDVLFATDQFALTQEAQAVVDGAAAQMKTTAQSGAVSVVGHTDDVNTEAYNQDLSVKRAQAVSDRLAAALGATFTLTAQGRGESEPVAAGTSVEARAANRRVEIRFTAKVPGATSVAPGAAPVPPATGATAIGNATVDVTSAMGGGNFTVRASSVVRTGGYLVGSLEVSRTSAGTDLPLELFGGVDHRTFSRGLTTHTSVSSGAYGITLLGAGTRYFPSEYVAGSDPSAGIERKIVADEYMVRKVEQGQTFTATVIWPDPGGATVTIDAPKFRLTDVPVKTS